MKNKSEIGNAQVSSKQGENRGTLESMAERKGVGEEEDALLLEQFNRDRLHVGSWLPMWGLNIHYYT